MEEKELIEKACEWFEYKYGNTPQKAGMEHIKIWHKILPFHTMKCIVFAPNQKLADHFTFMQNVIFATLSYFWIIIPFSIIAFISDVFYHNIIPLVAFVSVCLALMVFYLIMAFIGKKWEKEYIRNIIVCNAHDLQYFNADADDED